MASQLLGKGATILALKFKLASSLRQSNVLRSLFAPLTSFVSREGQEGQAELPLLMLG